MTAQAKAEYCIRLYRDAARSAAARGDMLRARGYGERATMWVQRYEALGELEDGRRSAFAICKAVA